jgi:hypothetical protein
VSNLDGIEAKLRYLKAWQSLPEYGISTFVVKFQDSNKKEVSKQIHFIPNSFVFVYLGIIWYCFKSSFTSDNDR